LVYVPTFLNKTNLSRVLFQLPSNIWHYVVVVGNGC